MLPTARCLASGFWKRSLDEFKRQANIAFKLEGVYGVSGPMPLIDFTSPGDREACKVMSDADIGGFSKADLDWVQASVKEPPHVRFHGKISIELPPNNPDVQRTGYAGWRTLDRRRTLFGKSLWDIDPYTYLAIRFKSDGRKYFVNLQTESIVPTDIHQHRLFSKTPGEWETVIIKWSDFVRTNHGIVVEPQSEMMRQKLRTVGFSLIDRVPGPFEVCISRIWATNGEDLRRKSDGTIVSADEVEEKAQSERTS